MNLEFSPSISVFSEYGGTVSERLYFNLYRKIPSTKNLLENDLKKYKITLNRSILDKYTVIYNAHEDYLLELDRAILLKIKTSSSKIKDNYITEIILFTPNHKILEEFDEKIIEELFKDKKEKVSSGVYFIERNNTGFLLSTPVSFEKEENFIEKYYNDDFKEIHNTILTNLNAERSREKLYLLHGLPGTGKTSYIRHLSSLIDKKFIFLPSTDMNFIADASFIPFMRKNKNSVLILEDSEAILASRHRNASQAMPNLLNMTDGLLGDLLNTHIICTFNTDIRNIDSALLRKGRIAALYNFKELSKEKANKLNNSIETKATIAEIFNSEKETFSQKREMIGFNTTK